MYDQETGLVYTEAIVSAPRTTAADWFRRCRGRKPTYQAPARGPPSLQDVAIRLLLCNLDDLELHAVQALPDVMLQKVWEQIRRQ